jgi:hypothetical protein
VSEDVDSLGRFDVSVIVVLVGENDKDSHGIICKRNSNLARLPEFDWDRIANGGR